MEAYFVRIRAAPDSISRVHLSLTRVWGYGAVRSAVGNTATLHQIARDVFRQSSIGVLRPTTSWVTKPYDTSVLKYLSTGGNYRRLGNIFCHNEGLDSLSLILFKREAIIVNLSYVFAWRRIERGKTRDPISICHRALLLLLLFIHTVCTLTRV